MVNTTARIIRIEEPDFGCEGRPEGEELRLRLVMETVENGEQVELEVEEQWLTKLGLQEGRQVELLMHSDGTAMIQAQE